MWVRTLAVVGLLWALLAGLPAGPGGVCILVVLSVLCGSSPILAEGAAGDVVGGGPAGGAMVSLVLTVVRVSQLGFGFGLGLGFGVGFAGDADGECGAIHAPGDGVLIAPMLRVLPFTMSVECVARAAQVMVWLCR